MIKANWFRKFLGTALATTLLVGGSLPILPAYAEAPAKIDSAAAYLIDAQTGQVLYAQNENGKRFPASTTKLMTLLLVMDAVKSGQKKVTDIVPIPKEAYNIEGSSAWLDPSEKWTLQDMIKFIAVPSANDACVATSIFIAGSEQAFVQKMNEKAKELGMAATHFTDTNGLHNPDHYTTAHDLSIVARELITTHPEILDITKVQSFPLRNGENLFENTNKLLGRYEGMDGLKTGFTDEAGYNLVGTAQRNGFRLIGVMLGSANESKRESETVKLLDIGFTQYDHKKVFSKNQVLSEPANIPNGKDMQVPVAVDQDLYVDVLKGKEQDVHQKIVYNTYEAPIKKGQVLGQMQMVNNEGQVLSSVNVIANSDVDRGSWFRLFFRNLFHAIANSFKGLFH